jgi:hypothetical protein
MPFHHLGITVPVLHRKVETLFYLRLGTPVPVEELLHRKVETLFYLRLCTTVLVKELLHVNDLKTTPNVGWKINTFIANKPSPQISQNFKTILKLVGKIISLRDGQSTMQ